MPPLFLVRTSLWTVVVVTRCFPLKATKHKPRPVPCPPRLDHYFPVRHSYLHRCLSRLHCLCSFPEVRQAAYDIVIVIVIQYQSFRRPLYTMPSFRTAFLAVATALVATVQADYRIEPSSVPLSTRKSWCQSEISTCPSICRDQSDTGAQVNTCDPDTLTYGCLCGDNTQPNVSEYSLTLPYFVCTEWGNQCVKGCGLDSSCASACRQDHPCGASNPSTANETSATATSTSQTASSTSANPTQVFDGAFVRDGQTVRHEWYTGNLLHGLRIHAVRGTCLWAKEGSCGLGGPAFARALSHVPRHRLLTLRDPSLGKKCFSDTCTHAYKHRSD
ncbi:hypothetical protein FJTKL_04680 [Diaporthe vaccinii]|uniref:DUF7707 domain-containing protein n=1 Tax=Diaporthe vaccinii TaxID=105482 RepID=A0ABR4EZL7_9PEZI